MIDFDRWSTAMKNTGQRSNSGSTIREVSTRHCAALDARSKLETASTYRTWHSTHVGSQHDGLCQYRACHSIRVASQQYVSTRHCIAPA
eukprot:480794-Rhodomonas_salina.1